MTEELPDWIQVPNVPLHEGRGQSQYVRPFTTQQLQEFGRILIEQFLQKVVEAVAGFFIPGGGIGSAFDQLQSWAEDVLGPGFLTGDWSTLLNSLFGENNILSTIIASVVPGLDASKIITGIFGTGTIPGLDVSKIITGIFGSGFIPGLDTSKIITGQFGQSMITNLVSDLGARLLSSIFNQRYIAGSNLVIGPDFEDTTITRYGSGSYSTDQAHGGTHSWKLVADHVNYLGPSIIGDYATQSTWLRVAAGQKFYMEAWVYPKATNVGGGSIIMAMSMRDSKGVVSETYPSAYTGAPPTAGQWTKISGFVTVPAGCDLANPYVQVDPIMPAGDTIYWDDVIVREETAPQNIIAQLFGGSNILSTILAGVIPGLDTSKIITGLFPQSQVTGLTTIASNLSSIITNLFGGSSVLSQIIAGAVPGLDTSKIITGNFSQSMITNLVSDLGARLLKTVFQGSTRAGSNLFISPTFDDTSIARISYNGAAPGAYSTTQKHSGTHSWTWTNPNPSFWSGLYLAPNEADYQFSVSTGDKFYMEFWLYAPTGNNHAGGGAITYGCTFQDSTGVNSNQFYTQVVLLSAFTKGAWTKFTGHTTAVPTGYDRISFNVQNDNNTPVGNVYYVDDVIIREETQEQSILGGLFGSTSVLSTVLAGVIPGLDTSKIVSGTFGQSMITNLVNDLGARLLTSMFTNRTTAGSNLVLNPDFEDTTLTMGGSTGNYSTEQSRTGTHSWKFVNTNAWEAVEFHNQSTSLYVYNFPEVGVKVQPGQKFYGEVYVRPHASNTKPSPLLNLQITISDSKGVNSPTIVVLQQTTTPLAAGTWTKFSGYGTIPAGYDRANLSWQVTDVSAIGDTYYLDNALFREETAATDIKSTLISSFGGSGNLLATLSNAMTNLLSGFDLPDMTVSPGSFNPDLMNITAPVQAAQNVLDAFAQQLGGLAGSFLPLSSYSQVAGDTSNTIQETASAVAAMQALLTQSGSTGGLAYFHDFSLDADSSGIHSDFVRTYSGAGSRAFVTSGGRLQWLGGTGGPRQVAYDLNTLVTETDYQLIGVVWSGSPGDAVVKPFWWSAETHYYGYQWITGRMNAAGTQNVILIMRGDGLLQFQSVSGGVTTILDTQPAGSFYFPPGAYYLQCGTSGNIRTFRLLQGTNQTPIWTYTDGSAISALGASNRRGGAGAYADDNVQSSPVVAFSMRDNTPPTILGSAARFYRSSTSTVTHAALSQTAMANSFFDSTDYKTSDFTWTPGSNNAITVANQGRYIITVALKSSSTTGLFAGFSVNGVAKRASQMGGGTTTNGQIQATWVIPLSAGDIVRPTLATNAAANALMTGSANGFETFIEISKMGNL